MIIKSDQSSPLNVGICVVSVEGSTLDLGHSAKTEKEQFQRMETTLSTQSAFERDVVQKCSDDNWVCLKIG